MCASQMALRITAVPDPAPGAPFSVSFLPFCTHAPRPFRILLPAAFISTDLLDVQISEGEMMQATIDCATPVGPPSSSISLGVKFDSAPPVGGLLSVPDLAWSEEVGGLCLIGHVPGPLIDLLQASLVHAASTALTVLLTRAY